MGPAQAPNIACCPLTDQSKKNEEYGRSRPRWGGIATSRRFADRYDDRTTAPGGRFDFQTIAIATIRARFIER